MVIQKIEAEYKKRIEVIYRMDAIKSLFEINYASVFISVFIILAGIKAIISLFEWLFRKFGLENKWMRQKREYHEVINKTSENLSKLQEKHNKDNSDIIGCLSAFINETRKKDEELKTEMRYFSNNRIDDRAQLLEIQKELTNSIKSISDANSIRDNQINNLMIAQREILANEINLKYKYYISLHGIPEDEVDEFTNLHLAYKGCGGNSSGDAKYEYCINHLPIIPVETKLVLNHKS